MEAVNTGFPVTITDNIFLVFFKHEFLINTNFIKRNIIKNETEKRNRECNTLKLTHITETKSI